MLKVYEVARSVVRRMAPVCAAIEARDGDLSRQARRAMSSVLLNMREGSHSQGRNRNARYWNATDPRVSASGPLVVGLLRDRVCRVPADRARARDLEIAFRFPLSAFRSPLSAARFPLPAFRDRALGPLPVVLGCGERRLEETRGASRR